MSIKRSLLLLITLAGSLLFLNACKSTGAEVTPTSLQITLAPTDLPATSTPIPAANKVWLVNGSILPSDQITFIQNQADQSGLILEQFPSITCARSSEPISRGKAGNRSTARPWPGRDGLHLPANQLYPGRDPNPTGGSENLRHPTGRSPPGVGSIPGRIYGSYPHGRIAHRDCDCRIL